MKHGTYYACTKYREGSWPNAKYRKSGFHMTKAK